MKLVEINPRFSGGLPITAEAACDLLGRCAITELPIEVYQLMDLYKMDKPQRKGIEYVPLPSRRSRNNGQ